LKGKSAIAIARSQGRTQNFGGSTFWTRGYAVSTVGFDEQIVRGYIKEQDNNEGNF
jgi:putative transposase